MVGNSMITICSILAHMVKDRQGSFGLLTAFLLVPLVGAVGLAIDISQLESARVKLQIDLDAAVLSGANTLVKGTAAQAKADAE